MTVLYENPAHSTSSGRNWDERIASINPTTVKDSLLVVDQEWYIYVDFDLTYKTRSGEQRRELWLVLLATGYEFAAVYQRDPATDLWKYVRCHGR